MANIIVPATGSIAITGAINDSGNISLGSKTITLNTKDTYVYENIDVIVSASASVQAGSLNNEPSGSTTYTENTAAATVIPSGGYLYINEGWLPNTMISLSHLIPEIADHDAGDGHILSGYKAYDEAGNVITGTMAEIDPTFSGGTITVTPSVTNLSVPTATIQSTGTFKTASTYGVTTTQPTGTGQSDGTTYLTIDGTISKTDGSVKATAEATRTAVLYNQYTAGHLSKSTGDTALDAQTTPTTATTTSATTITPTIADNFAPLYIPIVTASFGGGVITPTAGGSVTTAPKVTYSESAAGLKNSTAITLSDYAIESTDADSSNNYITFTASGSPTDGTVQATANATSTAVTYTNDAGAIAAHSGATAKTPTSNGQDTENITVTPTAQAGTTTKYRIPIVTPAGTGGNVTVNSTTITNLSGTAPSVTPSATGTFLPSGTGVGATYGVTTTRPSGSGQTDGSTYVTITPSGTAGSQQAYTADITVNYNRAAVTTNAAYKGAVSMSSGASLLTASNNQSASKTGVSVGNIQATVGSPSTSYYIPIVTPAASGGGLSDESITCTPSGTFTITPKVEFASRSGSSESSMTNSAASTTYGIVVTGTAPTSGDYLKLDPGATPSGTPTVSASVTVTRAAITVSSDAGLTNGNGTGITSTSKTYNGSASISDPTISAGTNFYIPVVTVPSSSSVNNSVTNPTVDLTAGAAYGGSGAPSGSVSGFTSTQPSGAYVVITPGKNVTSGTVTSTVSSITISKGITAGGTISGGTDTDNIGVTDGTTTNYYVKVYDGSYTVV